MMSCITPTKRLDMWFKDLSVKTTEYSSSPSGSTSRRGRLTSADCHKTPSHWSANLPLRGTQRPYRTHLDGAGEVRPTAKATQPLVNVDARLRPTRCQTSSSALGTGCCPGRGRR